MSRAGVREGERAPGTSRLLTEPPPPTRVWGGNALSHSFERSSLLEGREAPRITPFHGLGPRSLGVGGAGHCSPEPAHQGATHVNTRSRPRRKGRGRRGQGTERPPATPSPHQGRTCKWAPFLVLGGSWAPEESGATPSRETLPSWGGKFPHLPPTARPAARCRGAGLHRPSAPQ